MNSSQTYIKEKLFTFLDNKSFHDFLSTSLSFELLNHSHSNAIIPWRNDQDNINKFIEKKELTYKDQEKFLANYWSYNRIDLVLVHEKEGPIGVFSLKNINTNHPELGKLLGNTHFRGKGIAKMASASILNFGFSLNGVKSIYAQTQTKNKRNIRLNQALGFEIIKEIVINNVPFYLMERVSTPPHK